MDYVFGRRCSSEIDQPEDCPKGISTTTSTTFETHYHFSLRETASRCEHLITPENGIQSGETYFDTRTSRCFRRGLKSGFASRGLRVRAPSSPLYVATTYDDLTFGQTVKCQRSVREVACEKLPWRQISEPAGSPSRFL